MSDVIKTKWLTIVVKPQDPKKKTCEWTVCGVNYGPELGVIKWWAAWRKYCFFPAPDALFEQDCLRDIAKTVEELTHEHKFNRMKAKGELSSHPSSQKDDETELGRGRY